MPPDSTTRAKIRALVRDVLENAVEDSSHDVAANTPNTAANSTMNQRANVSSDTISSSPKIATHSELRPTPDEPPMRDESAKTILTEADLLAVEEGSRVRVREGVRLTALAADIMRDRRIELVTRTPRHNAALATRNIAIGSDHGGYEMKIELNRLLEELNQRVRDFSTHSTDAVDYPDIAHAVAQSVAQGEADLGIIIDGAGIGSAMTANKVKGIRAAACYSVVLAKNSREHNGANVLTLGSKINSTKEMREIVAAWLVSDLTEERHRQRVQKIEAIERQYSK